MQTIKRLRDVASKSFAPQAEHAWQKRSLSWGLLTATLTVVISLAVSPLASAEHGSGDDSGSGSSSTTTTSNSDGDSSTSGGSNGGGSSGSGTENETETEVETASANPSTLHARAQQFLEDKRKSGKQHSEQERQQACEKHKAAIEGKLTGLANAGQKHLDNFNRLFEKVQAYETKNQIAVSNYDALVAAATAKQTAATTAVAALKNAGVTIDCTTSDPAANLAINKTAADDARTALQAYKSALKDLITAIMNAKSSSDSTNSQDNTTTGGNQ